MHSFLAALLIAGLTLNGPPAGASLDQSIKQLPARHKIGPRVFSAYSRAADLGAGIPFYAILGIGAAIAAIGFALAVWYAGPVVLALRAPAYAAGVLSVLHSIVTPFAAPGKFSQKMYEIAAGDAEQIAHVLDRFARLQNLRCGLQVATFGSLLWVGWILISG